MSMLIIVLVSCQHKLQKKRNHHLRIVEADLANIHGSSFLQIGPRSVNNINVVHLVACNLKEKRLKTTNSLNPVSMFKTKRNALLRERFQLSIMRQTLSFLFKIINSRSTMTREKQLQRPSRHKNTDT